MDYKYLDRYVYYEKKGSGKPIILLHGWGVNSSLFHKLSNDLKNKYTVYLIDLPGFGRSEEPSSFYTLNDYVNMIKCFTDDLQIYNPIILGHSFGGRIAIRYTAVTNYTSKLILVDSAGVKPKNHLKTKIKILKYKIKKKYYKVTKNLNKYLKLLHESGSEDYKNATPNMKKTLSVITKSFQENDLKQITCETLLIWGKNDFTTPLKDCARMNKLIKNSKVKILETGHFPFLDNYEEFFKSLSEYLGE